jgi:hypothetical protein
MPSRYKSSSSHPSQAPQAEIPGSGPASRPVHTQYTFLHFDTGFCHIQVIVSIGNSVRVEIEELRHIHTPWSALRIFAVADASSLVQSNIYRKINA